MISNCPNFILNTGETHQLTANVAPINATHKKVIWSSSNSEVASVGENGLVSAISQGSVKITVTTNDGGYSNTCNIGIMGTITKLASDEYNPGHIKIYPNPVANELYFEFPESKLEKTITIYNTLGQLLIAKSTFNSHYEISVSDCAQNKILIVGVVMDKTTNFIKVLINSKN